MLKFELRGLEEKIEGVRYDARPKMESIKYEIIFDSDETDRWLSLLLL